MQKVVVVKVSGCRRWSWATLKDSLLWHLMSNNKQNGFYIVIYFWCTVMQTTCFGSLTYQVFLNTPSVTTAITPTVNVSI